MFFQEPCVGGTLRGQSHQQRCIGEGFLRQHRLAAHRWISYRTNGPKSTRVLPRTKRAGVGPGQPQTLLHMLSWPLQRKDREQGHFRARCRRAGEISSANQGAADVAGAEQRSLRLRPPGRALLPAAPTQSHCQLHRRLLNDVCAGSRSSVARQAPYAARTIVTSEACTDRACHLVPTHLQLRPGRTCAPHSLPTRGDICKRCLVVTIPLREPHIPSPAAEPSPGLRGCPRRWGGGGFALWGWRSPLPVLPLTPGMLCHSS